MDTDDPLADLLKGLDEIEGSEDSDAEIENEEVVQAPAAEENMVETKSKTAEPMDVEPPVIAPKFEKPPPKAKVALNRRPSFVKMQREKLKKRRSSVFTVEEKWLDVVMDINVSERKISAEVMSKRLESFDMLTFKQLTLKAKSKTLPDIWAFYAIVGKKFQRTSSKGKPYIAVKLTNFKESISLLAFSSKLRKECSKLEEGTFICIANPTVLDSNERFKGVSLVLEDANQIIEVGRAKDFDFCAAKTKSGRCKTAINKLEGKYCAYHVRENYRKAASRRGDINRSLVRRPSFGTAVKDMSAGDYQFNGDDLSTTQKTRIKQNCTKIPDRAKKRASRRSITIAQAGLTPTAKASPKPLPKLGQGFNLNESFEINVKGSGKKQSTPAQFQMPIARPRRVSKTIKKPPLPNAKRRGNGMAVPLRKRRKANVFQFDEIVNKGRRRKPTPIPSAEIMNLPINLRNPGQRTDSPILVQHIQPNMVQE